MYRLIYNLYQMLARRAERAVNGKACTSEVFSTLRTRIFKFRANVSEVRQLSVLPYRKHSVQCKVLYLKAVLNS